MIFVIGLLTLILVLDCLALVFLVLLQLPKKEAGAGLAFGGAATDALFGAGSGNVLTKITKYAATIFFITAVILAVLQSRRSTSDFERRLQQPGKPPAGAMPAPTTPATPPTTTTQAVPLTIPEAAAPAVTPEAAPTPAPVQPTPPAADTPAPK